VQVDVQDLLRPQLAADRRDAHRAVVARPVRAQRVQVLHGHERRDLQPRQLIVQRPRQHLGIREGVAGVVEILHDDQHPLLRRDVDGRDRRRARHDRRDGAEDVAAREERQKAEGRGQIQKREHAPQRHHRSSAYGTNLRAISEVSASIVPM
jgi:hypothetical protein